MGRKSETTLPPRSETEDFSQGMAMLHWALWLSSHCRFGTTTRTPSDPWVVSVFFFRNPLWSDVDCLGALWDKWLLKCSRVTNRCEKETYGKNEPEDQQKYSNIQETQVFQWTKLANTSRVRCEIFWVAVVKWVSGSKQRSSGRHGSLKAQRPLQAYDSSQSTVLWRLDWFYILKNEGTKFYLRNPNSSSILHREDEKDIYYTILGFSAVFSREFFTVSKLGKQPDSCEKSISSAVGNLVWPKVLEIERMTPGTRKPTTF